MQKDVSYGDATARWGRPSRAVLAVSIGEEGPADIIALGWKMHTSISPPMVAISVGLTRHSHRLIEELGEFVLSVPGESMAEATLFCGTHSGRDTDKFAEAGLTAIEGTAVRAPLIGEAQVNLECVVRGRLLTGDHTIFAGEVVASHVAEKEEPLLLLCSKESGFRPVLSDGRYHFGVIRNED